MQHSCTAELLAPAAAASSLAICASRRDTASSFVSCLRFVTTTVFEDSGLLLPRPMLILSSLVIEHRTSPTVNSSGAFFGAMPSRLQPLSYHASAELTAGCGSTTIGGLSKAR